MNDDYACFDFFFNMNLFILGVSNLTKNNFEIFFEERKNSTFMTHHNVWNILQQRESFTSSLTAVNNCGSCIHPKNCTLHLSLKPFKLKEVVMHMIFCILKDVSRVSTRIWNKRATHIGRLKKIFAHFPYLSNGVYTQIFLSMTVWP